MSFLDAIPAEHLVDGGPDWDLAVCKETDPELYFPEKGGSTREARRVCNGDPRCLWCRHPHPAVTDEDGTEHAANGCASCGCEEYEPVMDLCPIRDACLAYALDREERFGIWGGMSERQRRRIIRGGQPDAAAEDDPSDDLLDDEDDTEGDRQQGAAA